ncbi:MAG: hypothetical protein ACFE9Z_14955 [Promethearchaeota archaeon]
MSIPIEREFQKSSRVKIVCPICKEKGHINVPKYILKNHGVTTITIPRDSLCEHKFQFFLDRNASLQVYKGTDHGIILNPRESYIDNETQNFYVINSDDCNPLEPHLDIKICLIFNRFNNWILELVSPSQSNLTKLIYSLKNEIKKDSREKSTFPKYLNVTAMNEKFNIWCFGNNFLCINLKEDTKKPWMEYAIKTMGNNVSTEIELINISPRILLISEFFNHSKINKEQEQLVDRLISDDLLYSKIDIKFKDLVPQIIDRVSLMFSVDQNYLVSYFNSNQSTIEFLRTTESTDSLEKLIKVLDFLNRRNLIKR